MTTDRAAVPDPAERATLDTDLRTSGTETGFWDERGTPAPWPHDIDEWRPASYPPGNTVTLGRPTF